MGILLAFAPFIGFAVIDSLLGSTEGLIVGFAISAALLARDWLSPNRSPKVLEIGTAVLFGGLALYALLRRPDWSLMGVRLAVDSGLLLIVLVTIAIRQPFTLQYAREQVPQEMWASPEFTRTNYVITAVWALAFMALVAADLLLVYVPELPPRFGIIVTILALVGAIKFTGWYPDHRQAIAKTAAQ
jgi:FtsH-binding integral membrane protein